MPEKINVVLLAVNRADHEYTEDSYPGYLTEFEGVTVLERKVQQFRSRAEVEFIFIGKERDVAKWRIKNMMKLLSDGAEVISTRSDTKGAACSAMLAAEKIDSDAELFLISCNEFIDVDLSKASEEFRSKGYDAGVLTFDSIHPRYAYVRTDTDGLVVESAEKEPISRQAITGAHWFRRGSDFIKAAKQMIRKDVQVNDSYYISLALNQMVLDNKRIGVYPIDKKFYHPLNNQRSIINYDNQIQADREGV